MTVLPISTSVQAVMQLAPALSVAEAAQALASGPAALAIVGDLAQPYTLIQADQLSALVDAAEQTVAAVLDRLPPLLIVDADVIELDSEDLRQFAWLLEETGAPGLVVYQTDRVIGAIPWEAVAGALSLDLVTTSRTRASGVVSVPARTYICRKCTPRPTRRRPSYGDQPPTCPRDWLHGPMEREYR